MTLARAREPAFGNLPSILDRSAKVTGGWAPVLNYLGAQQDWITPGNRWPSLWAQIALARLAPHIPPESVSTVLPLILVDHYALISNVRAGARFGMPPEVLYSSPLNGKARISASDTQAFSPAGRELIDRITEFWGIELNKHKLTPLPLLYEASCCSAFGGAPDGRRNEVGNLITPIISARYDI